MSPTEHLLQQTATRLWLAALGRHCHRVVLALATLSLALLLAARLLGLLTIGFIPIAAAALPVAALVLALALARRPSARETARVIDARVDGKELFLTAALIAEAPGEFQPIVVAQAEERAGQIKPANVAPWRWQRGTIQALAALALLIAALRWLPQLDPFKRVEREKKVAKQEEQLAESRKLTARRAEVLTAQAQQQSEQMQQALATLDKTFKEAKPQEREATIQQLAEEQKELGELWRKVNNQELKSALDKAAQSFGRMDAQKLAAWREQLKKGDVSGLKQELSEMREQLKQLAAQTDPAEKRAQHEQLAQRLNDLADALKQAISSPQLDEALSRALSQLDAAKLNQISKEAMEAAMDSLQLSEDELKQLAQSLKDGEALEEALKSLQMARQLAGLGKLDGEALKGAQGMADYEALFLEKMKQVGESGEPGGSGMGPGIGNGAKRPENDAAKTGFKPEKSSSALSNGKMLLEWKMKEVGESGARAEEFRDAVREVKQGVSEALQAEQVPPGYHDAIKRYFDTLPEKK
jgi:hypothetical protein